MINIKKHVVDGRIVNSLGKLGIKQLGKIVTQITEQVAGLTLTTQLKTESTAFSSFVSI